MFGRMDQAKMKVSITLSPEVLREVDRAVEEGRGANRSSVVDQWLRRAVRQNREDDLRVQTIAYYESLTDRERREDADISRATAEGAARLSIDEG